MKHMTALATETRRTLLHRRAAALEEAARVDRELAALEAQGETAPIYGSRAPYPPPPRRSHRWMRDHGPALLEHGAERHGGRRGRGVVYVIAAERYAAWLAAQSTVVAAPVVETEDERFDRLAESAGLRATRCA